MVDYNTVNRCQNALLSERALRTVAGHAGLSGQAVTEAIQQAIDEDLLLSVSWEGRVYLAMPNEQAIRESLETVLEYDHPDTGAVARHNRALAAF